MTLQTFFLLSYLMDSLATAANGLVADSLGRDDVRRARAAATRCLLFGGGVAIVLAAGLAAAPGSVAGVFTDNRCSISCLSEYDACGCHLGERDCAMLSCPLHF